MKYLIAVLAVTLYFNSPAFGSWSTQDLVLEGVYLGLLAVDCGQTIYGLHGSHGKHGYERNPLLGAHPSEERIRNGCILAAFAHIGVSILLPTNLREYFILGSIFVEAFYVGDNSISVGYQTKY